VVKDGYTLLDGDEGDMALIPVIDGDFIFRPSRHAYLALQKQANFNWIPYNGTVVHADGTKVVLIHVILPVADDAGAQEVVKSAKRSVDGSGNLTVSFAHNGKTYTYTFENGKDGLVLR